MGGKEGIIVDAVEVTLVTAIGVQEVRVVTVALEDADLDLEVIQETEETREETGAEAGLGEVVATIRMREVEVAQEETEVTQERSAAILEEAEARATRVISQGQEVEANPAD